MALLGLLAATVGMLVGLIDEAAEVGRLTGLLALGQVVGHALLAAGGHAHSASSPVGVMIAAHAVAVVLGAALIAGCGHLCSIVSRALRAGGRPTHRPVPATTTVTISSADQPLRSLLLLAASMSHRGPPVSLAR